MQNTINRDLKIQVEQIKLLYRSLLPILLVNVVVGCGILFGLWDVVSQTTLMIWAALLFLLVVARVISYVIYRRQFKPELVQRYTLYFVIGTGLTGLLYGVGGVVMFPDKGLEYQLFILFVLVGMGAGAVSSLTTYLPAFFVYFPTSMLPISVKFILVGEPVSIALGIMSIAYVIALSYFGKNLNHTLIQSLRLGFENTDLVEQLLRQKDEAEQANIAKSKFLAAASHDLRQPLHALTLFTSVLDESEQAAKERKVVDQIKSSVQALQGLFNGLLDISRLEAGVMNAEKTDFYIKNLLDKLANDCNPQAYEKGLSIIWPDCELVVHSDSTLLEQILRNYVANAIRYTPQGEVRITSEVDGKRLLLSVIDTGMGIPLEEQKAVFKEFHQLNNPERDRNKGLGLGLAIVERTAKLLGHPINVKSEPGKGSIFSILVDLADGVEPVVEVNPETERYTAEKNKLLMLVIDDEISVREGTQNLLECWGCEVVTASDKEEAITQLKRFERLPDGIIADYRLRENHSGIDAINDIHKMFKTNTPVLIVTGDIATERLREVSKSGYQILHKPVAPAKLRAFVRNIELRK